MIFTAARKIWVTSHLHKYADYHIKQDILGKIVISKGMFTKSSVKNADIPSAFEWYVIGKSKYAMLKDALSWKNSESYSFFCMISHVLINAQGFAYFDKEKHK